MTLVAGLLHLHYISFHQKCKTICTNGTTASNRGGCHIKKRCSSVVFVLFCNLKSMGDNNGIICLCVYFCINFLMCACFSAVCVMATTTPVFSCRVNKLSINLSIKGHKLNINMINRYTVPCNILSFLSHSQINNRFVFNWTTNKLTL